MEEEQQQETKKEPDGRVIRYCDARRAWLFKYEELRAAEARVVAAEKDAREVEAKETELLGTAVQLERMQSASAARGDQPTADKLGVDRCEVETLYRHAVTAAMMAHVELKNQQLKRDRVRHMERLAWERSEAAWMGLLGFEAPLWGPER